LKLKHILQIYTDSSNNWCLLISTQEGKIMNNDNKSSTYVMDRKTLLALIEDMPKGGWLTTASGFRLQKKPTEWKRLSA
jgi:hypothetical protein